MSSFSVAKPSIVFAPKQTRSRQSAARSSVAPRAAAQSGITVKDGEAFAERFAKAHNDGYENNNHSQTMKDLFAKEVTWQWSDGFSGSGDPKQITDQLGATWGFMCSKFVYNPFFTLVDTTNSVIVM